MVGYGNKWRRGERERERVIGFFREEKRKEERQRDGNEKNQIPIQQRHKRQLTRLQPKVRSRCRWYWYGTSFLFEDMLAFIYSTFHYFPSIMMNRTSRVVLSSSVVVYFWERKSGTRRIIRREGNVCAVSYEQTNPTVGRLRHETKRVLSCPVLYSMQQYPIGEDSKQQVVNSFSHSEEV